MYHIYCGVLLIIEVLQTSNAVLMRDGVEVEEGSTLTMKCDAYNDTDTVWLFGKLWLFVCDTQRDPGCQHLLSEMLLRYQERVVYVGNSAINITNATEGDSGTYRCLWPNEEKQQTFYNIMVIGKPSKPTVASNRVTVEGDEEVLQCNGSRARGSTKSYEWHRRGTSLPQAAVLNASAGTLTFRHVDRSHAGLYRCRVHNIAGWSELSNPVNLTVHFEECKRTQLGREYQGTLAKTRSGRTCQRWDSLSPHWHTRNNPAKFPDNTLEDARNNCRNPDGEPEGPWCYTTDASKRWEYCDVKTCSSDRPQPPEIVLSKTKITANSVLLAWRVGLDGGAPQEISVSYQQKTGGDTKVITSQIAHPASGVVHVTRVAVNASMCYVFRVHARNRYSKDKLGTPSPPVEFCTKGSPIPLVVGIVVSITAISFLILVAVLVRRKVLTGKMSLNNSGGAEPEPHGRGSALSSLPLVDEAIYEEIKDLQSDQQDTLDRESKQQLTKPYKNLGCVDQEYDQIDQADRQQEAHTYLELQAV